MIKETLPFIKCGDVEVSSFVLQNDTLHGYVLYGGTGYMYSP
jgi:hypothetical protein